MLHAGKLEIEGELLNNYSFIQAKNISESIYKLNVKNLKVLHHQIGSYLGGRGLGLLRRRMTSAGAWNEIREMRGKGHNLSGPARTSLPHRVLLLQQTNSSIPGTTKLNAARVFYLGLCPSGLFIFKKNKFFQKKKFRSR